MTLDLSATNPMIPLRGSDSLKDALRIFSETGTHRVPILEINSVAFIGNVLTQSVVISWFNQNLQKFGPILKKSLKELNVQVIFLTKKNPLISYSSKQLFLFLWKPKQLMLLRKWLLTELLLWLSVILMELCFLILVQKISR